MYLPTISCKPLHLRPHDSRLPSLLKDGRGRSWCAANKNATEVTQTPSTIQQQYSILAIPRHLWWGDVGVSPVQQVEVNCDRQPQRKQEEEQSPSSVQQAQTKCYWRQPHDRRRRSAALRRNLSLKMACTRIALNRIDTRGVNWGGGAPTWPTAIVCVAHAQCARGCMYRNVYSIRMQETDFYGAPS